MLRLVPFECFNDKHIERMVASINSAPEAQRLDGLAIISRLQSGHLAAYEWDSGLVIVGVDGSRLSLECLSCDHLLKDVLPLVSDIRQIAAGRGCDIIETMVFDSRLASVIKKLGGCVESTLFTLAVE